MTTNLSVRVDHNGAIPVIRIEGEVDLYSSPQARKVILEEAAKAPPGLVVDLTGVSYMDSSGLATLVEGLQAIEKRGGRLVLCGMQPIVREVFELTHLDSVFHIVHSVEEALRSCHVAD